MTAIQLTERILKPVAQFLPEVHPNLDAPTVFITEHIADPPPLAAEVDVVVHLALGIPLLQVRLAVVAALLRVFPKQLCWPVGREGRQHSN